MAAIKVFCLDNSELAEYEAVSKGYRGDVYASISNQIYHLNVYDIVRLQQDFETELEEYGFFSTEPNLLLVKEANSKEIKKLVLSLYKQKYFEGVKPLDSIEVEKLNLVTM